MRDGREGGLVDPPPSPPSFVAGRGRDGGRVLVANLDLLLLKHGHAAVGNLANRVHEVVERSLWKQNRIGFR